jgi:hypothetical protein
MQNPDINISFKSHFSPFDFNTEDAWKSYMRQQTNTVNYSRELPLAQGVEFNLD